MPTPRRLSGSALLALFTAFAALGCDGEPVVGGHFDATVMKPEDRALPDASDAAVDSSPPPDVTFDVTKDTDDGAADVAMDAVEDAVDAPGDVMPRCTSSNDMCPVGQRCDDASGTCVPGCRNDEACMTTTNDAGARRARCDLATRACVECVTNEHCAAGTLCVGNQCVAGCNDSRPCPTGQSCCAGACVDLLANLAHCGACDARCTTPNATASCLNGNCAVATCAAPFGNCDGMAVNGCETNLLVDVGHCGGCGMMCPTRAHASSSCAAGRCEFTCDPGFADCDMNPANGCETDTNTDVARCGSCRTACNPPNGTPACRMGACAVATCSEGFADCNTNPNDGCEADTRASTAHCGACGRACPTRPNAFPGCVGGMCVTSCVMGFQDCDGDAMNGCEADVRADRANCGACGRVCDPAHATGACTTGRCTITACDTGFADCDMDASNGCEVNLQSDANHCAACGTRCSTPGGTPACAMGRCAVGACTAGRGDCDNDPSNGCEADLGASAAHCGGCGMACALANATPACTGGRCAVATCNAGFADCDMNPANGCETSLNTSTANCGRCGNQCSFPGSTASCVAGMCTLTTCTAGNGDCDANSANGCETALATSVSHCGACGAQCVTPNATPGCTGGRCAVTTCNAGFADCDTSPANGCEVNTAVDRSHCGACNNRCALANATPACASGRCAVASCDAGFADCDRAPSNGCEVNTAADARNCGACGTACDLPNATPACTAGRCAIAACNAGYGDCDGNPANGCETRTDTSTSHCGRCGNTCALGNATPTCAAGRCAVASCNASFGDCDGNPANGCETALSTSVGHCGACGAACALANATPACTGSRCAVASCNGGFGDCDGNPANGCETNLTSAVTHCGACGRVCSLANTSAAGCAGGACTVVSCAGGFANCDGTAGNGCETNLTSDANHCGGCGVRCPSGSCRFGACVSFGGGFENSDPGCASCANGNPTTGGCSCPAGFGTTSRLRVINDCRGGGTQVGAVITMCGAPAAGDWGGAFQQDDGVGCNQGCRAPNPYTGGCACPAGMVGIAFRTIVDTPCRTLIGSNITYCALASGPRPTFGGAFQLDDNVPGAAGCRRPNPYTGGCSCPAGFGQSPLRVEVDTARGFIGSAIFLCTR